MIGEQKQIHRSMPFAFAVVFVRQMTRLFLAENNVCVSRQLKTKYPVHLSCAFEAGFEPSFVPGEKHDQLSATRLFFHINQQLVRRRARSSEFAHFSPPLSSFSFAAADGFVPRTWPEISAAVNEAIRVNRSASLRFIDFLISMCKFCGLFLLLRLMLSTYLRFERMQNHIFFSIAEPAGHLSALFRSGLIDIVVTHRAARRTLNNSAGQLQLSQNDATISCRQSLHDSPPSVFVATRLEPPAEIICIELVQ